MVLVFSFDIVGTLMPLIEYFTCFEKLNRGMFLNLENHTSTYMKVILLVIAHSETLYLNLGEIKLENFEIFRKIKNSCLALDSKTKISNYKILPKNIIVSNF